ncbi:18136_t:CDS:2 [Gigaspora rosea]|nr:18136_t:CDS:2 [Gigaspora rosea]
MENSSKKIYRVSKKSKVRLVAEHWQIEDQDNYVEHLKLQPCKGCTLSTNTDANSCYRHFNKKESLVLIPKIVNTKFLPLSLEQYQHSRQKNRNFSLESKIERLALHLPSSTNILRNCNSRVQRISSVIMAIEPDLNQTNYDCKRLATQIKCLANKLPVLDELKKRRPLLYTSNECICCKVKVTETQDHLADCTYYEWSWINITKVAARVTWSKLSSTDQFLLPLVSYFQLVVGSHKQEIIELRQSYIKEQCRLIGLWEKEEGITIKEKRRKAKKKHTSIGKVKSAGKGKTSVNNTNTSSSVVYLEKSALVLNNSKKGIEEKSCTADSLWQVGVKSYIQSGEIPFGPGLKQI